MEVYRVLRTETRPVELIDAYMDFSRIVFDDPDMDWGPEGHPITAASRRISDNPALYAPEIRRRLLDTLPERIESAEHLAALRSLVDTHRLEVLSQLTAILGRTHADPILRELWDRSSRLLEQAEPIFDEASAESGIGRDAPKQVVSMSNALHYVIWNSRTLAIESAAILESPIFIEYCLRVIERTRERPNDWLIPNFAADASEYLLPFVEQRPDIYTRLLPLADAEEMAKLGGGADNLAYTIKGVVEAMRRRLIEADTLPSEK